MFQSLDEMIAALEAAKVGKPMEHKCWGFDESAEWKPGVGEWNFFKYEIRAKPKSLPEPKRWWLVVDRDGRAFAVRNTREQAETYLNRCCRVVPVVEGQDVEPPAEYSPKE